MQIHWKIEGWGVDVAYIKRGSVERLAWSAEEDETGSIHKVPRNPEFGYKASIKKPETWVSLEEA